MELCYIFRRNTITNTALRTAEILLARFRELRLIFVTECVRDSISLPRQHALSHYITSITLFGSPNGLCSSITESKHIKAVKEPWRRSSRFKAIVQMLRVIVRLEKLVALHRRFVKENMLIGSTAAYFANGCGKTRISQDDDEEMLFGGDPALNNLNTGHDSDGVAVGKESEKHGVEEILDDAGPDDGPRSLSSIMLATSPGTILLLEHGLTY
jgi:hypothetical protein